MGRYIGNIRSSLYNDTMREIMDAIDYLDFAREEISRGGFFDLEKSKQIKAFLKIAICSAKYALSNVENHIKEVS